MNLDSLDADQLESALLANGALSVTLTDAGDEPVLEPAPGETPLWKDTMVTALFTEDANFDSLRTNLRESLDIEQLPPHRVETLADRAWEREWMSSFGPMQFGNRLWVIPSDADSPQDDAVVVRLDPGLAFGTGTHATTALCLEWLDGLDMAGKQVFDFGCGSGILGVAALKLGAAHVIATDIDVQAVTATGQNAERNGVADALEAATVTPEGTRAVDVFVANILAGTLIEFADTIIGLTKPGGRIALSGILERQRDDVAAAFGESVTWNPTAERDGWVILSGSRIGD
jgi:ribosomal protein L11 methyltransferase